jgi:hypothetical protein
VVHPDLAERLAAVVLAGPVEKCPSRRWGSQGIRRVGKSDLGRLADPLWRTPCCRLTTLAISSRYRCFGRLDVLTACFGGSTGRVDQQCPVVLDAQLAEQGRVERGADLALRTGLKLGQLRLEIDERLRVREESERAREIWPEGASRTDEAAVQAAYNVLREQRFISRDRVATFPATMGGGAGVAWIADWCVGTVASRARASAGTQALRRYCRRLGCRFEDRSHPVSVRRGRG